MASIINPRDIQLQAASTRLVGVSLPPNVVVDPDNVDGLGLILDGIKRVWISATSQVFQIAKSGTISPTSITLTANIRNLTGTPTLTIVPGSGTMSVVPALTAGVFTFTPAQLTSDTITLRLSLTESSVTYSDDFTFVKVREGEDSINGLLTNESHTVSADSAGNVLNYNGASGTFKLWLGTLDIRTVSTFAVASGGNPDGLTVAITASGSNAGNYAVTGGFPSNKETVTITFNATFGTTVVPKVLTLTKSKAGTNGTSGLNGTRTAILDLYRWGSTPPVTFPSGTSVYTWATAQFTPPTTLNGWSIAPGTPVEGQILYIARQVYSDSLPTATSSVVWNTTAATPLTMAGTNGLPGSNGQRVGLLEVYIWGAVAPTVFPSGTSVYTWATGAFTAPSTASGWSLTPGAAVPGQTLWGASVVVSDNLTTTTSVATWNSSTAYAVGYAGANGTNGVRGSRSFYYALGGSTNAWSDVIATTTASVDGGPVLNDQVTEYNNSMDFSQTKFWNGSTWVNVDAVIDGNLLVKGTVGASKVVVNAAQGTNVWVDANYADASAWQVSLWGVLPTRATITDGVAGGTSLRSPMAGAASARGAFRSPVTVGKKYRVSLKARKSSTANGTLWLRLDVGTTKVGAYGEVIVGIEGVSTVSTSWQEYSATWTATAPWASPVVLVNHNGTAGYMEAQDIRIEEMNAAGLVVQGGIVADQIDSRGLSIRDAAGNILFAAGTALDYSLVGGGTKPADNATVGAPAGTYVGSVLAQDLVTTANNASSAASAAQTSANAANTAIANISSDNVLSKGEKPQAVQDWLAVSNERVGIVAQANAYSIVTERNAYTTAHDALNTYLSGLSPAYNDASTDTPIVGTTYRAKWVSLYDARQALLNKIAQVAGQRATWASVSGSGKPQNNATVGATIGVNLSGQITSGNASTYIANAAIGSAQIGTINANQVNAASLSAITATIGTLRTATSGGRVEIMDNKIRVYDTSNALRVSIGYLL